MRGAADIDETARSQVDIALGLDRNLPAIDANEACIKLVLPVRYGRAIVIPDTAGIDHAGFTQSNGARDAVVIADEVRLEFDLAGTSDDVPVQVDLAALERHLAAGRHLNGLARLHGNRGIGIDRQRVQTGCLQPVCIQLQVILFLLASEHHGLGLGLGARQINGQLSAQCLGFRHPLACSIDRGGLHFAFEAQQGRLDIKAAGRLALDIRGLHVINGANDLGGLAEIPTGEILGDATDDTEILDVGIGLGNIDHRAPVRTDQLGGVDVTRGPEHGTAGIIEHRSRREGGFPLGDDIERTALRAPLGDGSGDTIQRAGDVGDGSALADIHPYFLAIEHAGLLQGRVTQLVAAQFQLDDVAADRHIDILYPRHVDQGAGRDGDLAVILHVRLGRIGRVFRGAQGDAAGVGADDRAPFHLDLLAHDLDPRGRLGQAIHRRGQIGLVGSRLGQTALGQSHLGPRAQSVIQRRGALRAAGLQQPFVALASGGSALAREQAHGAIGLHRGRRRNDTLLVHRESQQRGVALVRDHLAQIGDIAAIGDFHHQSAQGGIALRLLQIHLVAGRHRDDLAFRRAQGATIDHRGRRHDDAARFGGIDLRPLL